METAIGIISKVCDFLGGLDYAKAFDAIENVLIELVKWIASLVA